LAVKNSVKYVVLALVVGQIVLASACTQSSGVRYISTQEPAAGSEREFVVHVGKNNVENLETELSQKLEVVSQSYAQITESSTADGGNRASQGEQIAAGVGDSPFSLTVPVEEVVANLDDGALVEVAVDLGVISSSEADELILAERVWMEQRAILARQRITLCWDRRLVSHRVVNHRELAVVHLPRLALRLVVAPGLARQGGRGHRLRLHLAHRLVRRLRCQNLSRRLNLLLRQPRRQSRPRPALSS